MSSRPTRNSRIRYAQRVSVVFDSIDEAIWGEVDQAVPCKLWERQEVEAQKIEDVVDERAEDKQRREENFCAHKVGPPDVFSVVLVVSDLLVP